MEAVFHYTHALKLDPKNYSLYSNRSLAFLKSQQYYYALQDAVETIRLQPDWAKVCPLSFVSELGYNQSPIILHQNKIP